MVMSSPREGRVHLSHKQCHAQSPLTLSASMSAPRAHADKTVSTQELSALPHGTTCSPAGLPVRPAQTPQSPGPLLHNHRARALLSGLAHVSKSSVTWNVCDRGPVMCFMMSLFRNFSKSDAEMNRSAAHSARPPPKLSHEEGRGPHARQASHLLPAL